MSGRSLALALAAHGSQQAVEVRLPSPLPLRMALSGLAGGIAWEPETLDLVEVAASILLADRSVRRGPNRSRHLRLHMPVRSASTWRDLAQEVTGLLEFLTGDRFDLEFYQGRYTKRQGLMPGVRSHVPSFDRVALFSGGLDSAAAAALFAAQSTTTVFVSHYVTGIRRLEGLLGGICQAYGGRACTPHAGFFLAPAAGLAPTLRENTRRTRSFLFASLAVATAAGTGAKEIAVCENGPLALNLALSSAMVPTRHAHSRFLLGMESLARRLLDIELRVVNPFELQTKGEITRLFSGHPELALETTTCWNQQWSGRGRRYGRGHCGLCLPCLVRRAALTGAGIDFPEGHFDIDILRVARKRRKASVDHARLGPFRALLDFCDNLGSLHTWQSFIQRFPEVLQTRPTSVSLSPELWYESLFRVMQRFRAEVIAFTRPFGADIGPA